MISSDFAHFGHCLFIGKISAHHSEMVNLNFINSRLKMHTFNAAYILINQQIDRNLKKTKYLFKLIARKVDAVFI